MPSVKTNIILNIANTVFGLLFPLITFPYVSRILMPEGIGIVQFYQSIINYIVLLCALGIPLYAVREIARYRDNEESRNKATVEILVLHAFLSFIGYIIVFILIITVKKIYADWPLFLLLSLSIFFNVIGVTWFYQAVEDFKYITIRSLIFRLLSLIALFVFVSSKNDLYAYAIILVAGQVGNYLINFFRLRKFSIFNYQNWRNLNLTPHLKSSFKIFILNVAISLYVNINPVMLGFMTDDVYVGYYTSVTRIITAINALTSALCMAILPRMSNYYVAGKQEEYDKLKNKSLNVICSLAIPISICLIVVAPNLIPVFSGNEYLPAILTLRISAPTLFFSAINTIIAIQILYTQNKEKIVIIATTIGGMINIILNLFLIPLLRQNGTAISGLSGEITVLIICLIAGAKYINYNFNNKSNKQVLLASIICAVTSVGINFLSASTFILLPIQLAFFGIGYLLILISFKNELCLEYLSLLFDKIRSLVQQK